jgi:hypothetical protein
MEVLEMFGNLMKAGMAKMESVENITYDEITNTLEIIMHKNKSEIIKITMTWDKSTVTTYHYRFKLPFNVYEDDAFNIIASIVYAQKKCC